MLIQIWRPRLGTLWFLIMIWMIVIVKNEVRGISELTTRNWIFLGISGLATGISWIFYFKALQMGEVSKVAGIDKLSLALTIILAVIFLNEELTWKTAVGASFIIAGTVFLIWK